MLRNVYLDLQGNTNIQIDPLLLADIQQTFTIEFWVSPAAVHKPEREMIRGVSRTSNKQFVLAPMYGAYADGIEEKAGVGIAVGTNCISVYEHTANHMPATLVYLQSIEGWTHIAVVYQDGTPHLYVNGKYSKTGVRTGKVVSPSGIIGGISPYGFFTGSCAELRIWSCARTQGEIEAYRKRELLGQEENLVGYWKCSEGKGDILYDSSPYQRHGTIQGSGWGEPSLTEKVLFTFYIPSGGVETLNRQRFYALTESGLCCHFLYLQAGTGLQNKLNTQVFVTNNDREIIDIIRREKYKAIIVGSDVYLLQKLKKSGYTGRLIYEVQGLGFNKEYAEYFIKQEALPILKDCCDAILYPRTPHLAAAFAKYFPHIRQFSFDNCFNSNEFHYEVHPKHARPIVGWVGRIEENKNWRDFLRIGAALIQYNPDIELWMFEDNTIGEKAARLAFGDLVQELQLKDHLHVYANQPHARMATHFSMIGDSGGFLCSTSKVEGFGYAVLEAMVCRCPVLSTDSDGVKSFIIHNETGKFFRLGDIEQAVMEARELMENTTLREALRNNGAAYIAENFSPRQYATSFAEMLKELGI
ncbi:glycosyltransferase [Ectobacillus sp. JY-23]|uniref:glycosyltransferase n=1 Tax=Ectobacillus sp. JY-23 TaxID=2933872 RepID=UPI001FF6372B|nr:glycosyltransferase [Ectobacillus sp. JY-23]UOY92167.1 glycosyltransferase [Ectobacillus sp. JY-23]